MQQGKRVTNEQGFDKYRSLVESEIRRPAFPMSSAPVSVRRLLGISRWAARYSRRRDAIAGIPGFGSPLLDQTAKELLVARHLAVDAAYPELPDWGEATLSMSALSLANLRSLNRIDVASLQDACGFGPSLRHLWTEAKRRGEADEEAWQSIESWAYRRPPAWDREDDRRKRKLSPSEASVAERAARPVAWRKTQDLDRPWMATVDGQAWKVRLNDFPDEWMYSLLIDGSPVGDLHDWPSAWYRGEPVVRESDAKPTRPARPLVTPRGRYLERYLAGEHEAVWAELVALGDAVRERQDLAEARAVAKETMRRARHNVETIIRRLDSLGYEFWNSGKRMRGRLARLDHLADPDVFRPAPRGEAKALDTLEREGLVLPLSLRAWMEDVGSVDLCGSHPTLCFFEGRPDFPGIYADPLMVAPNADLVEDLLGLGDDENDLLVSFGAYGKAGLAMNAQVDDQYSLELPNAAADGLLKGEPRGLSFVEYLRLSFRWGGFPGWADQERRPERELSLLTKGLLPI